MGNSRSGFLGYKSLIREKDRLKKRLKETNTQTIIEDIVDPVSFAGRKADKALGTKIFEPAAEVYSTVTGLKTYSQIAGQVGRQTIDKKRRAKEDFKRGMSEMKKAQAEQLSEYATKKEQSAAEKSATTNLNKARAAQRKRSKKKGRASTILTDTLGGAGGEGATKKNLLGL